MLLLLTILYFVYKVTYDQAPVIKEILAHYMTIFGQQINQSKSSLAFF